MTILIAIIAFSLGWTAGSWWRGIMFDNLGWRCFRWSTEVFGFRPVVEGTRLHRGDKLIMGLDLDSSVFPEEGIIFGEDGL